MNLTGTPEEEIKFPKHKIKKDTSDDKEKHRALTIDFQIELDLACAREDIQVLFCDRYFDKTGNTRDRNLKSRTALIFEGDKTLEADMTFMLQLENGQNELYLFEQENGTDSGKGVDKMIQHAKAIVHGHAHEKYEYKRAYRTLWVFEEAGTMQAILKRLEDNPFFVNMKEYFLLKSGEEIRDDFFGGWRNLDSQERKLFYL